MRVLIVDSYYPVFVARFYGAHSGLRDAPYAVQWRVLMDACFGTADFYSSNLVASGHDATEVVVDCEPLQHSWAREHHVALRSWQWAAVRYAGRIPLLRRYAQDCFVTVLTEQAREFRPDVIHFQDPVGATASIVARVRPYTRFVTAQIASRIPPGSSFAHFDLMLSSFPHYVKRFAEAGLRSAYFNLGFEPRIRNRLRPGRLYDVVFVGGLSRAHASRRIWLEALARRIKVDWWGYGVETLSANSPLRDTFHGQAWALDMYQILFNSRIALNHHIDEAGEYANNMRLYEATGVGALLVTDAKANLDSLFAVGQEVIAYRDADECAALVEYYLANEGERQTIARAGQERTLRAHTYEQRMREFIELVTPMLR